MTTEQQQYIVQLAQNVLGKFNDTYFKSHRWTDALDALGGVSEMYGFYAERARDPQTYDPDYHRSAGQACNWAAAAIMAELRGNSTPAAFWKAADDAARIAARLNERRTK